MALHLRHSLRLGHLLLVQQLRALRVAELPLTWLLLAVARLRLQRAKLAQPAGDRGRYAARSIRLRDNRKSSFEFPEHFVAFVRPEPVLANDRVYLTFVFK